MQYKQLPQLRMASSAKLSIKKIKQFKKTFEKAQIKIYHQIAVSWL